MKKNPMAAIYVHFNAVGVVADKWQLEFLAVFA